MAEYSKDGDDLVINTTHEIEQRFTREEIESSIKNYKKSILDCENKISEFENILSEMEKLGL